MSQTSCPHCGKALDTLAGAAFCPFCGAAIASGATSAEKEPEAVVKLLEKLERITDPKKKHELLLEAEKEYPQSLLIAQEQLFLGKLHDRGGKNVDFSIIKCYLLSLYLEPEQFTQKRQDELRAELFAHPQLMRCLALSEDQDAFMRMYLIRLSGEFIHLFLRGDSRYMRRFFGMSLPNTNYAKLLAVPAVRMLANMREDDMLSGAQRDMMMRSFYQAFSRDVAGDTKWLDEKLHSAGVVVSGV